MDQILRESRIFGGNLASSGPLFCEEQTWLAKKSDPRFRVVNALRGKRVARQESSAKRGQQDRREGERQAIHTACEQNERCSPAHDAEPPSFRCGAHHRLSVQASI